MSIHPAWWLVGLATVVLAAHLVALARRRLPTRTALLRIGAAILLITAALQPRIGGDQPDPGSAGPDVLLLVDRTTSMAAQDWADGQPRMSGVTHDITRIVEQLPGARVALISFDNEARVSMPWTTDSTAVISMAETIGWRDESFGSGSDIGVAGSLAREVLTESATRRPGADRYLVYFGDGEQTAEQAPASLADLAPLLDDARVFGYGTEAGATMLVRPDSTELVERAGTPQISRLDAANLQRLADELGGSYAHRTGPDQPALWPQHGAVNAGGAPTDSGYRLVWLIGVAVLWLTAWDAWHGLRAVWSSRQDLA